MGPHPARRRPADDHDNHSGRIPDDAGSALLDASHSDEAPHPGRRRAAAAGSAPRDASHNDEGPHPALRRLATALKGDRTTPPPSYSLSLHAV